MNDAVTVTVSEGTPTVTVDGSVVNVGVVDRPTRVEVCGTTVNVAASEEVVRVNVGAKQGPAGPVGPTGSGPCPSFTAENKSGGTLPAGRVVAVHSSGAGVTEADATDDTLPTVGLAVAPVAASVAGEYRTDGPLSLADWSGCLESGAAYLSPKSLYFLSATTPGTLTPTAPTTVGRVVQSVGYALTSDTLQIEIEIPILL